MSRLYTTISSSLAQELQPRTSLEMASPTGPDINPISQTHRIRPEWEVIDLENGTCTTQVYLYPDEVNLETHPSTPQGAPGPDLTASTTAPIHGRDRLYRSHSRSVTVPANTGSSAMPNNYTQRSSYTFQEALPLRLKNTSPSLKENAETYVRLGGDSTENWGQHRVSPSVSRSEVASSVAASTLMTKDVAARMSALNYSVDITDPSSPTVHTATLLDTTADHTLIPKSPRTEYISTFSTPEIPIAVNNLRSRIYRRALTFDVPAPAKTAKPANPYITIERLGGSSRVSLRYDALPMYSVTDESEYGDDGNHTKKQELAGPYRAAALWEFVGQTFARGERYRKLKPKKKKIVKTSLGRITPVSNLSKSVLAYGEEGDSMPQDTGAGVWERLTSGIHGLDWSSLGGIAPRSGLSSPVLAYNEENDRIHRETGEWRRVARGTRRSNRHPLEWNTPLSDPELAYGKNGKKQQETGVSGEWSRSTSGSGKLA
jgi:hypothetical protein